MTDLRDREHRRPFAPPVKFSCQLQQQKVMFVTCRLDNARFITAMHDFQETCELGIDFKLTLLSHFSLPSIKSNQSS